MNQSEPSETELYSEEGSGAISQNAVNLSLNNQGQPLQNSQSLRGDADSVF